MSNTAFIGAGHIAQAIMGGYLETIKGDVQILASDPMQEQLDKLPSAIQTSRDNLETVENVDTVVLCVKPNLMAEICQPLSSKAANKLFISVAAGITVSSLSSWLGKSIAIIRCMPNTPALVQQGMTGLYANEHVTAAQKQQAEDILGSVGLVQWFNEEASLDAVTAISGSGPAYFFLVIEAMQKAAESLGLSAEISKTLVLQTALGAAQMASDSDLEAEQLRINVTSPGGTTQAALEILIAGGLSDTFNQAIKAAFERSKALSAD